MAAALLGDRALERKLAALSTSGSRRALTAGVHAGLTKISQGLRAAINTTDAPPEVKRAARKSIGKRFKKGYKSDQKIAKAGFAVGKKRRGKRLSGGTTGGVGISVENIHWFVLGTDERVTKAGRRTGRIPPMLEGVTDQAVSMSESTAIAAARAKIAEVIAREARRKT